MHKETFVTIINEIINQIKKESKLSEVISEYFVEPVLLNLSYDFVNKITDSLAKEFDDEVDEHGYHMINWWLYDSPNAGQEKESCWVEYDNKKFSLLNAEELFDFLKYKMDNK